MPSEVEVISQDNLRKYFISLRHRGNTPRTLINNMQGLRSFCNFLIKKGYLPNNPFIGIEKPKLSRRLPEFLNEEESRQLLKACIDMKSCYKSRWCRDISIIALFLFTGIRKRELLNLKMNDVNLELGFIKVFAKNKERLVPLNETVVEFMKDYFKVRPNRGFDYVFVSTNRKQSPLTTQGLYDMFRELRKRIKSHKKICCRESSNRYQI